MKREYKDSKEMKFAIVDTLLDLIKEDNKIVALDADLASASGFSKIQKESPNNFIQCGISEANMIGVSSGLSLIGFKPFLHSFAPFVTRRVFDQLFISGGYAKLDLNIIGTDPGVCVGPNGGTHTSFEDVALIKMIPNSMIYDVCDYYQLEWLIKELVNVYGIKYIRTTRKSLPHIYNKDQKFELNKGILVEEGNDVLIITSGILVKEALDAKEILKDKVSISVIDIFCLKPIDKELIINQSKNKKLVITFENHSITNGLGSTVCEVFIDNQINIPLKRIGINEEFGQVGTVDFLQKEYNLTKDYLVSYIKDYLNL